MCKEEPAFQNNQDDFEPEERAEQAGQMSAAPRMEQPCS